MADEPTQQDTSRNAAAISLAERLVTAYHEAGHAVMALILGRQIHKITIAPGQLQIGGVRLGACQIQKRRGKGARDAMEDDILFLLAGMVAESHLTERYCATGASQDLAAVRRILRDCPGSERQLERLERRFLNKTEHLLSAQASVHAIELIAKQLLEHTTVSGRAAVHLFEIAQRKFGND